VFFSSPLATNARRGGSRTDVRRRPPASHQCLQSSTVVFGCSISRRVGLERPGHGAWPAEQTLHGLVVALRIHGGNGHWANPDQYQYPFAHAPPQEPAQRKPGTTG